MGGESLPAVELLVESAPVTVLAYESMGQLRTAGTVHVSTLTVVPSTASTDAAETVR